MNLELANDERKAISTSKQLSIIKKLEESGKTKFLNKKLKDFIELRSSNYDLSISEIADRLGISRSSLRRRIKILEDISEK